MHVVNRPRPLNVVRVLDQIQNRRIRNVQTVCLEAGEDVENFSNGRPAFAFELVTGLKNQSEVKEFKGRCVKLAERLRHGENIPGQLDSESMQVEDRLNLFDCTNEAKRQLRKDTVKF